MNDQDTRQAEQMLSACERTAYAAGYTGLGFSYILLIGFITFYYTDVLGLSASVVGTILLISRVFDGLSDLVMGWLIDRTHTKLGKARPWILAMAIPNAAACILAFAVPQQWPELYRYIYVFLTYNMVNSITYTAENISIFAANCLLTSNPAEHAKSGIWMQIGCNMVVFLVQYTCLGLVEQFGGDAAAWTKTIAIYAFVGAALTIFCGTQIRERVITQPEETKIPFRVRVHALFGNKYWVLYTVTWLISSIQFTMADSGCLYYASYVLADADKYTVLATMQTVLSVVLMLAAGNWAMQKWGGVKLLIASHIMLFAASAVQLFTGNWNVILVCTVFRGIWAAINVATPGAMMADVCQYGSCKAGFNISGIGNAGINFGSKLGTGLGSMAIGWILSAFGHTQAAGAATATVVLGVKVLYLICPAALCVLGILVLLPYDLYRSGKLEQLQEEAS